MLSGGLRPKVKHRNHHCQGGLHNSDNITTLKTPIVAVDPPWLAASGSGCHPKVSILSQTKNLKGVRMADFSFIYCIPVAPVPLHHS